jgi:molybdenum cofactor guanylyltransferase
MPPDLDAGRSEGIPLATVGVILAGGRGQRFGGTDKGFLQLAGKPLIVHVISRIGRQVSRVVINANATDGRYRQLGLEIRPDAVQPGPATGPLVGLTTVFAALRQADGAPARVLSVPVDTPFLPFDLVGRFCAAVAETGAPVAFAASRGRNHPTVALWTRPGQDALGDLFAAQPQISLHGVMQRLRGSRVEFADDRIDPFFNVNTLHDLQMAERMIENALPAG